MKSPPRLAVALFLLSLAASCSGPVQESPEAKTTKPRAAQLSGRAETLKTAHPKWNDADCNAIAEGKIRLYMNQEQVRAAWGEPDRIKVVADSEAVKKEIWILAGDRAVTFNVIGAVEAFEQPGK
ncbi:MAG: hypothetical protein A2Z40_04275 [Deltaproteobacteria bacterium RBG_19FT_COMBO_60_16]|nr:MAG: hypothetical protein A2Z40_04275 [Deltaproteobacteria bacterium RBG_19FT_COMBO_60_16]